MASNKPRGGKAANAIIFLLLTLTGAGIGLAAGGLSMAPEADEPASAEAASPAKEPEASEPGHGGEKQAAEGHGQEGAAEETPPALPEVEAPELRAYPFPPVLTVLAEPKGTWIRIEGTMLVDAAAEEKPEILVEQAATNLLGYLRSVELRHIEGPSGLIYFQQDINEMVSSLSSGQVREVLIHTLVIE